MCQLLGMNCATPTDFNFSFSGFRLRGGVTDKHSDGFGLSFYQGRGLRTFVDTLPAASSPLADMVSRFPIKTLNMIAHIRYATQGETCLANVHPFQRELWGCYFSFCHNGDIPKFSLKKSDKKEEDEEEEAKGDNNSDCLPLLGKATVDNIIYTPVGDTDSEAVFCAILNALKAEFDSPPPLSVLYSRLQEICFEIVDGEEDTSIFNFLLACGQFTLFTFSWPGSRPNSDVWNGLYYTIRQPPFTRAELIDMDYNIDFSTVTTEADRVAVIATKPLTKNEVWVEIQKGELLMFDKGLPYGEAFKCEIVEKEGRGLSSRISYEKLDSILIPESVNSFDSTLVNEVTRA